MPQQLNRHVGVMASSHCSMVPYLPSDDLDMERWPLIFNEIRLQFSDIGE